MSFKFMSAEEAASYINHGDVVGFSGFTPAGAAKAMMKKQTKEEKEEEGRKETKKKEANDI